MIKKFKVVVAVLLIASFLCMYSNNVYAEYDSSQREKIKVGFFAMDGYHMMDDEGNRSGYGRDVLQLMARYWDVEFEYVGYDQSWDDMQQMLEDGEIDMLSPARKTSEREMKYDFSRGIGSSKGILTVRSDNNRIVEQDYSTYNNMRVAFLNGNTENAEFYEFAEEKGFEYEPVYFELSSDMADALQSGEVDAIATTSLRQTQNERIIDEFDNCEYYFMVKKGNTGLLDQINYAIDQMNATEGDWKTELENQYYNNYDNKNLDFTVEEKAVIQEYGSKEHPLMVLCDPTRYPYSYRENGEMKGIIPDYFRKVAEYTGIYYRFIDCENRDEYIAYQNTEDVGLYIDARVSDDNWIESINCRMTAPYLTMRVVMVNRHDFNGKINRIATVDQTMAGNIEDIYVEDAEKIVYGTREEAMQAVADGEADVAFAYYYSAQAFVNNDQSGMLTYSLVEDVSFQYRMIVSSSQNHMLAGILTKSIYAMPENLVEELASEYTSYKASDVTLKTLIQLHPIMALCIAVLMSTILIMISILLAKIRNRKRLQMLAMEKADEMKILAEQAQAANLAKSTFLANMSHDIRTPMNAIIGFTHIAMENNVDSKIQNCLEKIEESSNHLLSLINNVLDISRIESGNVKCELAPNDIAEITESVLGIMKGYFVGRNLKFEVQRAKPEHLYVMMDSVKIKEILLNILSNAVKYTEDGGTIRFESEYCSGIDSQHILLRCQISDTGIGIDEEFQKHIFEHFTQENIDARTEYNGTGLGLAITKQYIEMMGGTIFVKSKKGVGSTFTVEIPMERAKEKEQSGTENKDTMIDLSKIKLLMAEDNDLNAEIAIVQLQKYGMQVTRAVDGVDVVQMFEGSPAGTFDVILMDIMMPRMNGYEATRAIRNMEKRPDGKTIPIIAMTANAFAEDIQASLNAKMDEHVAKPIVIETVINAIVRNLNR